MTRYTGNTHTVHGTLLGTTSKAQCFEIDHIDEGIPLPDGSHTHQWFPFSQIEEVHRSKVQGELDSIVVSEWILQQKELLE